jgi:hypothetical protein
MQGRQVSQAWRGVTISGVQQAWNTYFLLKALLTASPQLAK